ncbi:GSCFA domain-containing protein [Nitritalea halalkaliphila LW7]|uniref:GSCFA domain-containing protein n=1 Tax=Nitritalea halalkaliphila LW7 TaxID=1189621 RepID=I5C535_9BACT|nr:GSCFA domain-containing protein [Nitritalea halalkaliphila]EIM76937.1 GSCFA domain-containing protein [Nitritalea halalkaliphila LW7]
MSTLYTPCEIPEKEPKLDFSSFVVALGSCFSTVMGGFLQQRKFETLINPFGTLFNPISILRNARMALQQESYRPELVAQRDGLLAHYETHGDLMAYSEHALMRLLAKRQSVCRHGLLEASHVFLTFGTAWVHEHSPSGTLVANCHKQPAAFFTKRLLQVEEIVQAFEAFYLCLQEENPDATFLLTVSPVRHTREGLPQNQLSKSVLRLACHEIEQRFPGVHYFPAYELMLDELRDYRFYKEDLIHPSPLAEEMIWERFKAAWIHRSTFGLIHEFEQIQRELAHRPINPEGVAHQRFVSSLLRKLERFDKDFDFSKEIEQLRKQAMQQSR